MTATAPKIAGAPGAAPKFKQPSALSRMKALMTAAKADDLAKDARSILLHVGVYMDLDGVAYPSATRLAEDSGYSERAVRKAMKDLREAGIVLSLPPKATALAFPNRGKVPKHLPLLVLWPVAPRLARYRAVRACGATPSATVDTEASLATSPWSADTRWIVTTKADPSKTFGPFTTADVERFAKDEKGAADWLLRNTGEPADKAPTPLRVFYWFAPLLPRVPAWARNE